MMACSIAQEMHPASLPSSFSLADSKALGFETRAMCPGNAACLFKAVMKPAL